MSRVPASCAYLVSQYPALSHVFVENEVAALRALGWRVETFSVRPTGTPQHPEAGRTTALQQGGWRAVLGALSVLLLSHPHAVAAGAGAAWRWGRGRSLRRRVWQGFYLAEALVLHREMRRRGLRHVHVHFANNSADIARLACTVGRAVDGGATWTWSLAVHGSTELDHAESYGLAGKAASADLVTCITDFCRSQVMRHLPPETWDRLHVVPMGVPAGIVHSEPVVPAGAAVPDPGVLRLLFVGRLVPEKGPHVLLEAADQLARSWAGGGQHDRRVDVVMIGAGPLRESLEQRARMLHPSVGVRLLGGLPHEQLLPWYSWAQVFCLPSFAEGLPVVLMEALAHGLPVVTTPIAGIPELVVDQDTGVLVAPGRADLLAAALRKLADDPVAARRLGGRGLVAVRSRHDAHANGILLAALLSQTISGDE